MPLDSATPRADQMIHGVTVRDPYRWLEDRKSPETEKWIRAQQHRYETYFASCPNIQKIAEHVQDFLDVESVDQPVRVGACCFYRKRRIGQEQSSIYLRTDGAAEERLLVDPAWYGGQSSVGLHRISADGKLMAFEIKRGGRDRKEIHIMDVERGAILPDTIPLGYARGFVFTPDGTGYLYVTETGDASEDHVVRQHLFGDQGKDEIVFSAPRFEGSRLILTGNSHRYGAYWLRQKGSDWLVDFSVASTSHRREWTTIIAERQVPCSPIFWHDKVLVLVDGESDNKKLIELSVDGTTSSVFISDLPPQIRQLAVTQTHLYASYLDEGISKVDGWHTNGRRGTSIPFPTNGTIDLLPFSTDSSGSIFYTYESFDTPPSIFEMDSRTGQSTVWFQTNRTPRTGAVAIRRESFTANDGARVPLSLVTTKGRAIQSAPVIMTSYGGFGVTLTPRFSVLVTVLLELHATLAIPHIRGGGDFGSAWHDAGQARNRQVAIDDFIAAADWLCQEGLTTPSQLAIFGGSNAGLLVAAVMTQRPGLFGAVLCIAPLLDMIRFEVLDHGDKWRIEYGTVEDPEDFRALHAYSPYHHVQEDVDYPATMFVTGDQDERCNPAHVRKMAALLQDRTAQSSTVIVDYSEERGHSPTMPLSTRIAALTRRIAFLCRELGLSWQTGDEYDAQHC